MIPEKCAGTVLVVGETIDGSLSAGSRDLGKQARRLAGRFDGEPVGVLTGNGIEQVARSWSNTAGMPVIVLDHAQCRYPNPSITASAVEALVEECSPLAVCFPHNMRACQAAATLAWRIKAPCITAVDSLLVESNQVVLKRAVFGGKLSETVTTGNRPMVLTIMPGLFSRSASPDVPDHAPSVETRLLTDTDHRFIPQGMNRRAHTDQALERAQVVVAAGRGLKGTEHTGLLDTAAGHVQTCSGRRFPGCLRSGLAAPRPSDRRNGPYGVAGPLPGLRHFRCPPASGRHAGIPDRRGREHRPEGGHIQPGALCGDRRFNRFPAGIAGKIRPDER